MKFGRKIRVFGLWLGLIQGASHLASPMAWGQNAAAPRPSPNPTVLGPTVLNPTVFHPTPQDRAAIALIEGYLTRLTSFTARFTQLNQDGGKDTGVFYCLRQAGASGKLRIDYDKPNPISLITAHGMLVYIDRQRDEGTYIPLDSSLVGLFAEPVIHFGDKISVTSLGQRGDLITIGLSAADTPDFGEAMLSFRRLGGNDIALAGWQVLDGSGNRTEVAITSLVKGIPDTPNLFNYVPPQMRGHGGRN
ncbi:MAG: outer membrane lipoprotein carrier protein LolA [Candidatus Symbiobacter sp.]|nr:outer membrane lipoprotein carrier protein LolA [Candidatus Symbiobacter sp.]